jgi:hypothetical protein
MKLLPSIGLLLLGGALGALLLFLFGIKTGPGDDEPIIMAGGSMRITTILDWGDDFVSTGGMLVHDNPMRMATNLYVSQIVILDTAGTKHYQETDSSTGKVQIDMNYCVPQSAGATTCQQGTAETVSFITTSVNQGLTVTSTGQLPTETTRYFWDHPATQKKIEWISINGKQVTDCLPSGLCNMVIHYCKFDKGCREAHK